MWCRVNLAFSKFLNFLLRERCRDLAFKTRPVRTAPYPLLRTGVGVEGVADRSKQLGVRTKRSGYSSQPGWPRSKPVGIHRGALDARSKQLGISIEHRLRAVADDCARDAHGRMDIHRKKWIGTRDRKPPSVAHKARCIEGRSAVMGGDRPRSILLPTDADATRPMVA